MAFQPFHYEQIAPQDPLQGLGDALIGGYKSGQQMRSTDLANAMAKLKLGQEPQDFDLNQQLKQAQIQKAMRPDMGTFAKALSDYKNTVARYGANSEEANLAHDNVNRVAQGSKGITISTDPITGKPVVQIGGGGGSGRNSGGSMYRTEDGTIVQTPTNTVKTALEKRIQGAMTSKPYLDRINQLAQFQSPWTNLLERGEGFLNKYTGTDFDLPSKKAYGLANLKTSAEGLIGTFGLQPTDKNVGLVMDILRPNSGESPSGYRNRLNKQLRDFAQNEALAQKTLMGGYRYNPNQPQSNEFKMPSFKNKAEFQQWYASLSPEEQAQARAQLGGK